MKNITTLGAMVASFALCIVTSAYAQSLDGLYQPSGQSWSCLPEQVGMDGGALSVEGDIFNGLENRCQLTNPRPNGAGTTYTAVCSAEGEESREDLTLTPTANGIRLQRIGSTSYWERCGASQDASVDQTGSSQPSNGRWVFGFGQGVEESSTRDANGNSISFSCMGGIDGGLYVELGGQPISGGEASFDVDGNVFGMTVWADGGRINTECTVCGQNYTALWGATAAGNLLTVGASDGRSAAFSLSGSRDALGDTACLPSEGF
jgi:hypothetical protein